MRILLAIAVSLSFFAGQTCGGGMSVFHPPVREEGEVMSRLVVKCGFEGAEVSKDANADCGPGQCLAGGKREPETASVSAASSEHVSLPDGSFVGFPHARSVAWHDAFNGAPFAGRTHSMVRRE